MVRRSRARSRFSAAKLQHVAADDGIFWLTKQEFFRYFETLYLCAKDMSEFLA